MCAMRMKTDDRNNMERDRAEGAKEVVLHAPKKKPHVLLIYRKMIPSVRLCGHCQMEYLAGQGAVEYRAVQEMKLKSSDLDWTDAVLLGRLDNWYERRLAELLHESGRYLVYIIDDDLLSIPPEISSAAYYNHPHVQKNIRAMIALSDAVLSPSPILLNKYADGKLAIQIEEPAIDPVSYKPHDPDAPVRIGFAGSIDRTGDIEHILKDALIQIRQTYGDRVMFEFFGAIPSFAKELGARCIPYCDSYDEYRRTLNALEWDIGLAPMPDTPFHACKHYNKFVEYAAAGVIGMYSDVMPYCRLREFRDDLSVLVNNESNAWVNALQAMIENKQLLEHRRQLVSEYAAQKMSVDISAQSLLAQLIKIKVDKARGHKFFYMLISAKLFALFGRVYHTIYSRITKRIAKEEDKYKHDK